jgi:hypothetical protein
VKELFWDGMAYGLLINRLQPVPLESLESLLQRLRWANHYQEPTWLTPFLPRPPTRLNMLWRTSQYAALSALTGLDVATLVGLTFHRFTPRFYDVPARTAPRSEREDTLPIPLWTDNGRHSYARSTFSDAVCPLCWRERRAILLPWSLYHVTTCPTHGVVLVDQCPGCGAAVHLDVRRDACERCGQEIGAFPTWSIAGHPDSIALTGLIWSAIGCQPGPFPPAVAGLAPAHPLGRVRPSALLQGLWACAQRLVLCHADTPLFAPEGLLPGVSWDAPTVLLQELDVLGIHTALAAAWRLLRDWSTAWHTVLRPRPRVAAARSGRGVPYPVVLRFLGDEPVWMLAERWWLDFLWDRSAEGYPWARFDLQVAPVAPCYTSAYEWADADLALPFEEAARYCQLNLADLDALAEAGLLRYARGPFPKGPSRWLFSERALHRSLRALLRVVPVCPLADASGPVVDLAWVLGQGTRRHLGIAEILCAVGDGTLPALRPRPSVQLCDLWFEQEVAARWLEHHRRAAPVPRRWAPWEVHIFRTL